MGSVKLGYMSLLFPLVICIYNINEGLCGYLIARNFEVGHYRVSISIAYNMMIPNEINPYFNNFTTENTYPTMHLGPTSETQQ